MSNLMDQPNQLDSRSTQSQATPAAVRQLPFFFNHPPTTEIYTLSLHDALPISSLQPTSARMVLSRPDAENRSSAVYACNSTDRKSTRLNSSHPSISYAVFCLKKKTKTSTFCCFLKKKKNK